MSTTLPATTDKNLDTACATVAGEIARTDGKASLLLAFNGAVLAGLASVTGRDLPTVTKVFGTLAVLALGAAAVLLLLVARPRLGGHDRASFPYWARLTEAEIQDCMDADARAARVRVLSGIAVAKFTQLRRAVDLTLLALVLLGLAAAGLAATSSGPRRPSTSVEGRRGPLSCVRPGVRAAHRGRRSNG